MNPASRRYPWRTFAFLTAAGTLTGPLVLDTFARNLVILAPAAA